MAKQNAIMDLKKAPPHYYHISWQGEGVPIS